jgi:hypothetical protein
MLLENIDDDAPNSFFYKHLLERMRDLSVIVPGMKQHERVEVFEYFAKLYQSIEKKEKYFSNEKEYQQDLRVGYAWGYVKKTSSNNIVYFVAANGKGSLLYMPDGTVHFAANNTDKDFYPHMPGAELPTSLDDTKFLYTYPVVPRVSDL